MDEKKIKEINNFPQKAYIAVTGGGTKFISDFFSVGGASKTIVGAEVPYDQRLMKSFIGADPEKYVCPDTARKMAMSSMIKGAAITGEPDITLGVGCTAALATENEREGRINRVAIAIHGRDFCSNWDFVFKSKDRAEQEEEISDFIIKALHDYMSGDWAFKQGAHVYAGAGDLLFGDAEILHDRNGDSAEIIQDDRIVVFPGAFNPIHKGHEQIMDMAQKITGKRPIMEISTVNVDKPPLNIFDMAKRASGLAGMPLIFTRCKYFSEKALTLRGNNFDKRIDFIVGLDTWERFATNVHQDNSPMRRHKTFYDNVGFLVFNRGGKKIDEHKHGFENVVFIHGFDNPVSSTEIRSKAI